MLESIGVKTVLIMCSTVGARPEAFSVFKIWNLPLGRVMERPRSTRQFRCQVNADEKIRHCFRRHFRCRENAAVLRLDLLLS